MVLFTAIVFFLALILIIALFTLKQWELSHARVFCASLRQRADARASRLKSLVLAARKDAEHLPPFLLDAAQSIVHGIAVDTGHVAMWLGRQSHRLADTVSHKRNFEPRQTKSEFLRKVSEHKNGYGSENGDEPTSTV